MKAILFDFGGTLDTNGIHWSEFFWDAYTALNVPVVKHSFEQAYLAAERGLPGAFVGADDDFSTTVRTLAHRQLDYLAAAGIRVEPALAERVAQRCIGVVRCTVAAELPVLQQLARRYAIGVVSNYYGNLEASLKELRLAPYFRAIVDSARVGLQKPDPALFRLALEALGTRADETYVVGDSYERDIVPAKRLGCVTVWLRGRSWHEPTSAPQADYVIVSLHELLPLLRM